MFDDQKAAIQAAMDKIDVARVSVVNGSAQATQLDIARDALVQDLLSIDHALAVVAAKNLGTFGAPATIVGKTNLLNKTTQSLGNAAQVLNVLSTIVTLAGDIAGALLAL
jgi:hypothetical protein